MHFSHKNIVNIIINHKKCNEKQLIKKRIWHSDDKNENEKKLYKNRKDDSFYTVRELIFKSKIVFLFYTFKFIEENENQGFSS